MKILINKPIGFTSFDIINILKKTKVFKKIGHTGTLDPFASGLLILLTDEDTKEFEKFLKYKKTYIFDLSFGFLTDTLDITGKIIKKDKNIAYNTNINTENITKILEDLKKNYIQTPPLYSAKKINGQRSYKLAREKKDQKDIEQIKEKLKQKAKKVNIFDFKILDFKNTTYTIQVTVNSGFYIRSLGLDIAKRLDTIGTVTRLERTKIGPYSVFNGLYLHQLKFIEKSVKVKIDESEL